MEVNIDRRPFSVSVRRKDTSTEAAADIKDNEGAHQKHTLKLHLPPADALGCDPKDGM